MFDEGVALISAVIDKDSYNVGETVHLECHVNNTKCQQTIKSVGIVLYKKLIGKGDNLEKYIRENIKRQEYGPILQG